MVIMLACIEMKTLIDKLNCKVQLRRRFMVDFVCSNPDVEPFQGCIVGSDVMKVLLQKDYINIIY